VPIDIVTSPTLNSFKNRLDTHCWLQQDIKYNNGNLNYQELGVAVTNNLRYIVKSFEVFIFTRATLC